MCKELWIKKLLFAFVVKLAKIAYDPYYFLSYIMIVSLYQHLLCEIGLFSLSDGMSDMCFSNAILSRLCYTSILHPVKQFLYYKSNCMTYDDKWFARGPENYIMSRNYWHFLEVNTGLWWFRVCNLWFSVLCFVKKGCLSFHRFIYFSWCCLLLIY